MRLFVCNVQYVLFNMAPRSSVLRSPAPVYQLIKKKKKLSETPPYIGARIPPQLEKLQWDGVLGKILSVV